MNAGMEAYIKDQKSSVTISLPHLSLKELRFIYVKK